MKIIFTKGARDKTREVLIKAYGENLPEAPAAVMIGIDILDILDEMYTEPIYKDAWLKLSQVFGEHQNQEALDLMDSIMENIKLDRGEAANAG